MGVPLFSCLGHGAFGKDKVFSENSNMSNLVDNILDSPWCNNHCCACQELGQGDFYSLDQEKVSLLVIYLLSAHKKM